MTKVVLLDGGMSQTLMRRSSLAPHPLWGAHVMLQEPDLVRALHLEFLRAGARVLTLNTYSLTPARLDRAGVGDMLEVWIERAARLAREAASEAKHPVLIAGSVSPLIGSYRPDLAPDFGEAVAQYQRVGAAQAPHVDLFLLETMGSGEEARAAMTALAPLGKPVWLSFSLQDGGSDRLRGGETLADAVAALGDLRPDALLVNCCHPESVDAALPDLVSFGLPSGAYANGFASVASVTPGAPVTGTQTRVDLTPEVYANSAVNWVSKGARIVGGCCDIGPGHIEQLAADLRAGGHEIVEHV